MTGASFEVNSRTANASATGGDANTTSQDARFSVRTDTVQAPLGLSGTAVDLARWIAAHTPNEDGEPAGRGVLTPASVVSLMTPIVDAGRRPEDVSWLALGGTESESSLEMRTDKLETGESLSLHATQRPGWMSVVAMVPDLRAGIIVLTNSSSTGPSLIQHVTCTWLAWRTNHAAAVCGSLYDIYTVKVDGSGLTPVVSNSASELVPVWSPDGRRLAFHTTPGRDMAHIYLVSLDGSSQNRLTREDKRDSWPDWSPDGVRIAFTAERDGRDAIYTSLLDGSKMTLRAQDRSKQVSQPRWSPDGTRIAFFKIQTGPAPLFELWIMNADGSEQRQLAKAGPGIIDWSPDGNFISFEESGQIVLLSLADNSTRRVTGDAGVSRGASFSPDGRQLVYSTGPEGAADLYVINIDGSNRHLLLGERADEITPAWSPDGSTIVFSTNRSSR